MSHVKQELKNFGETTSFRGIARIIKSNDKFLKFMWIVAVLACTAVLVFLFVTLFTKFFNWPVTTKFGEDNKGKIVFPDVTVCSLNRFLNSINNKDIEEYFNTVSQLENAKNNSTSWIFGLLNSISGFMVNKITDPDPAYYDMLFTECLKLITECQVFYENWQSADECNYNISANAEYGLCLTIRTSQLDNAKNRLIRGMSLILNIGPPNLNTIPFDVSLTSSQAQGAVISIHPSGTSADIKRGLTVGPGTETVVKIVQTNTERLDKPHSAQGCTEQKMLTESPKEAYTLDFCNDHCLQKTIFQECGCIAHWFDIPETLSEVPFCANISQASDDSNEYILNMICSAQFDISTCEECKLPCKEISYQYSVASAPWPPPNYQLSFYRQYIKECDYPDIKERFLSYEHFEQNLTNSKNMTLKDLKEVGESFMVVKLVIESEKPFLLQDKPFYSWDVMVSLVGGILSLWLGVTAMTLFELFELLYRILQGCNKKSSANNSSAKNGS